jgi:hypothetical protein
MGKIVIVLALMASGSAFAVVIKCYQGANAESIQGASDDLKILRVGQTEVGYEVYVDDFFVASCDNIVVNGH